MGKGLKIVVLVAIVAAWVALDQWTKSFFVGVAPGTSFGLVLGGLVNVFLVHNTGAAWGILSDNTIALGAFSIAVVALLLAYFIWKAREMTLVQTIGIALIAAGGIGNAIDRFVQGYVTDFIAVTFIDFPVFNIADIGVTCGVIVLMVGLLTQGGSSAGAGAGAASGAVPEPKPGAGSNAAPRAGSKANPNSESDDA